MTGTAVGIGFGIWAAQNLEPHQALPILGGMILLLALILLAMYIYEERNQNER